jgi:ribosomal-protein-alanine N-acetyltransferase
MSGDAEREFQVGEASAGVIDAIVALERATEFAPHWTREQYLEMTRDAAREEMRRHLVIARGGSGRVIGFAAASMHAALPDSAVLESVAVAGAVRRAGVGRALCKEIFAWCRSQGATEIGLEVRRQSAGAIALYMGLGFVGAGVRPAYYDGPADDAVVMRKDLASV